MPLPRLPTADRAQHAVEALEAAMRSGELPVGAHLPSERDLAATLGIGRPALREAIRSLAERGLVETRHGVGTIVVGDHHRPIANALSRAAVGHHQQVQEVREILEIALVRLAAQRATSAHDTALTGLLERYRASRRAEEQAHLDAELHRTLADAAGNPLFCTMIDALLQAMTAAQIAAMDTLPAERIAAQHTAIVAGVLARDPEAAATAMEAHLTDTRSALRSQPA